MQQDSKQVQVDLQDLGYETSGRSENEAEREDTSSPGMALSKRQSSTDQQHKGLLNYTLNQLNIYIQTLHTKQHT